MIKVKYFNAKWISDLMDVKYDQVSRKIKNFNIKCEYRDVPVKAGFGSRMQRYYFLTPDQARTVICSFRKINTNTLTFLEQLGGNMVSSPEHIFGKDIVYKLFDGYTILDQHSVCLGRYRIDWYIPELNLAIEYDEDQHDPELDSIRQQEIEKALGCKFLRFKPS